MDSRSPGQLGDANNRIFHVSWRNHHQIGELIHDDQQIGIRAKNALATDWQNNLVSNYRPVEIIHVLEAEALEVVVAHVHFFDDPLQGISRTFGVRDDRRDEVGNTLIRGKFNALGINQHHANLSGRSPHEDGGNHRIDKA